MQTEYQIIEIKKYGHAVILYKAKTYKELKTWLDENGSVLLGKKIQIQNSTIIKKQQF